MRVVVDTNVVVSAILRDRLPEKVILAIIANQEIEWVASAEILAEYREVLRRPKFKLPDEILSAWDARFDSAIARWHVGSTVDFPRDVKDAKFLACAIAAEADYFITGDGDFENAPAEMRTRIITVLQFHDKVCQS